MEQKDLQFLANIHNALLSVETRGESTVVMGQCLAALKNFVETKAKKTENQEAE